MRKLYQTIETLAKNKGHKNITKFCHAAGIPRATMTELKSGRTKHLSTETLAKVTSCLGISIDSLLGTNKVSADDHDSKIVIVVEGSQVTAVYSHNCDAEIEVVDLDHPAFETVEEKAAFDAAEKYVDSLGNDPAWESRY